MTTSVASQQQQRRLVSGRTQKSSSISIMLAGVLCATSGVMGLYVGMVFGSSAMAKVGSIMSSDCFTASQVNDKVRAALKEREKKVTRDTDPRFSSGMQNTVVGMTKVDRDEFNEKFDMGLPLDRSDQHNNQVLFLYSGENSLPSDKIARVEAKSQTAVPLVSVEEASANCDYLHVILQDHGGKRRQCTALLGQYEAFHIQKFMRVPEEGHLDPTVPLRPVSRGAQGSGRLSLKPPEFEKTQQHWKSLQKYLGKLDDTLKILEPLAKKTAVNNAIVVQVCNFGQSELLLNFLCSSKRRGLDTSSIIVFATDQETYDVVHQMGGVTVVYLQEIFDEMPSRAARSYGDKSFTRMMLAKVYCVHLIAVLGYDVLFQDVDVIWYRNPLHYFHDENSSDASFDVYFQDDGNHALYYAPYSANTGFYYVRRNERTLHFFNSFLMLGDSVDQSRSHQIPLVALLQEHASLFGLKIKIFSRDGDIFPGGHAYHRRPSFMRDIFNGNAQPEIFHMSWTKSKVEKKKFFEQMGEWYLEEKCVNKPLNEIYVAGPDAATDMVSDCCSLEPNLVCHYRDKPSKLPCRKSPPIDKNGRSFW